MDTVKPSAADAFRLWLDGGNVVIEFGRVVDPLAGSDAAVAATDRVVVPVEVGRRLVRSLEDALRPHAARLRAAEAQALSPGDAAAAFGAGDPSAQQRPEVAGDAAALLLRLVGNIGVPYAYERSFRLAKGRLAANRFLLTVEAKDLRGDLHRRPLDICGELGMPEGSRAAAEANLAAARCFHFGFEGDGDAVICKFYLERAVPEGEARRARERDEPVLLHLAFKWELGTDTVVTTRYLWRQAGAVAQLQERLAQVYRDRASASLAIATEALGLAAERAPPEALQYLEVLEDENARRSFDLNLYNAKLQVKDIQHLLYRMRDHFGVRPGQFQALYDQIKTKALGHIAGGLHRNEQDFFNIYYGVMGLPQFHEAFR